MRYLEPKFSVGSPGTQAYADAWDRIFAKPKQAEFGEVPSECAEAPTAGDTSCDVAEGVTSDTVTVEVTAGCDEVGGTSQGAGGEGEVTTTDSLKEINDAICSLRFIPDSVRDAIQAGRIKIHPPSESAEGGVSGFPTPEATGATR